MVLTPPRLSQAFSNVGHSFSHIVMLLYPTVVIALESELRMGYGELLVLMTLGNVLFGVAALPAGWLGDRWSTLGMMVVFFIGIGLATIVTGLTSSPIGLVVGLALIGLFASIYHPVGMAWLVRTATNRGKALGVNGVFGSFGLASAALIAGTLTDTIHWRAAFIIPGIAAVITGLALAWCVRTGRVTDAATVPLTSKPAPHRHAMVRAFIALSITMLCTGLIYQSMATALPKIFAERVAELTGGTPAGAGVLASLVYFAAMGAQLLGGHLADRYSLRNVYLFVFVIQAPLLFFAAHLSGVPIFAVIAGTVLLSTMAIPVENSLLSHYSPDKWRGTAFGAKFVLALGVSALGVPLVAVIHGLTGEFYWYFVCMALFATVVGVVSLLLLPQDKPGHLAEPAVTVDR
jgi:MFS family permease